MASEPVDVELAALRAQVAELEHTVAERDAMIANRNASIDQLRAHVAESSAQLASTQAERNAARERVNILEGVCTNIRAMLDQDAPPPATDLEAAVAEFVSKLPKSGALTRG